MRGGAGPGCEVYKRETRSGVSSFVEAVPDTVLTYTVTGLLANSIQYFHIEAVSECGIRSVLSPITRLRRVAMDADNELIPPTPNAPYGVKLTLRAGGGITASWQHSDDNGEADAASFNVYVATGATAMDYTTPDHTVSVPTQSQDLGTFANDTIVRVVVRAVTSGGDEETNTTEYSATADAAAPDAPTELIIL